MTDGDVNEALAADLAAIAARHFPDLGQGRHRLSVDIDLSRPDAPLVTNLVVMLLPPIKAG